MTQAEHIEAVKARLAAAIRAPLADAGATFGAVRDAIDAAERDGVPKSTFPQSLSLPSIATRDHGLCGIDDAIARWKRDGWL